MLRRDVLKLLGVSPLAALAAKTSAPLPPRGQPLPLETHLVQLGGTTAIARQWAPGDTQRCQLCPRCYADGDLCLVATIQPVTDDGAELFSLRGHDLG